MILSAELAVLNAGLADGDARSVPRSGTRAPG